MLYLLVFYPRDSDYGNDEMAESVKEEKRRKQMEAVAEDLFNNERVSLILLPHAKRLKEDLVHL